MVRYICVMFRDTPPKASLELYQYDTWWSHDYFRIVMTQHQHYVSI